MWSHDTIKGRIQGGAPPPKIGKNMICWRKIVIFHTKYPKNVRASLCSAHFFLSAAPLTWNPGSAPAISRSKTMALTVSSGADPGFQVRGGAVKQIAPSGGRRENFWGISCEKSRFYAKKLYFSNFRGGRAKFLGYFMWKITILRQKNHIFSNFRGGGRARRVRPPLNPPLQLKNVYRS
jgi:hypothetical protein